MNRDLNDVYLFTVVAAESGFSAAARRLGLPVSSVSRRVRRLEERLGVELLVRTTRKVSLTTVGQAYHAQVAPLFGALDAADAALARLTDAGRCRLRVSAPLHFEGLEPHLTDVLGDHERVDLELLLTNRHVDLVGEGFDLVFRIGDAQGEGLMVRRVGTLAMALVASTGYLARRGTPTTFEGLAEHDAVLLHARAEPMPWVRSTRRLFGVPVHARLVVNSARTAVQAVVAGLGIAMLPLRLCADALASGAVQVVLPETFPREVPVSLLYPQRTAYPPGMRIFIDRVLEGLPAALAGGG